MSKTLSGAKQLLLFLAAGILALLMLLSVSPASKAYALDEPAYTPGEDYYIDDQNGFLDQNPGYGEANDAQGSTSYLLTCPFYLKWTSPSMTIHEGDDAYIACEAVGLDDLTYEWYLVEDGGKTLRWVDLVGPEHTISGLRANAPDAAVYPYRCVITNGDGMSTLTTDVEITVLPNSKIIPAETLGKTGDNVFPLICLLAATIMWAVSFVYSLRLLRKSKRSDAELQDDRNPEG